MRSHSARGTTPWRPHNAQRLPAGVYATGLAPGSHTHTWHAHNKGSNTDHYRHRKATEGPYVIPDVRHSDTTMAEPTAPRNTRPRYLTLDDSHEVIMALVLQSRGGEPLQEHYDTDSDLEVIPTAPASGASAASTPPASSIQALCPAWKRGHCTGEGWCLKQHPWPAADDGARPAVAHAAARAALC